jgi:hypothetical protein
MADACPSNTLVMGTAPPFPLHGAARLLMRNPSRLSCTTPPHPRKSTGIGNYELLSQLDKQIERLCENHPDYSLLVGIPYAGPNALGTILASTGDCTRFKNYRQYVAYTGYFARLERSQTIDHTRMSRRGNRNLKRVFFQIVAPMVWFDPGDNSYKNLYKRKKAEGRAWYEAMPFACAALARHVYHCLKFQEPYQVEKAFGRVPSLPANQQIKLASQADLAFQFEIMESHLSPPEQQ